MYKVKNIKKVYDHDLCCSCSMCGEICPQQSISYKEDKLGFYKPIVNKCTCINCGLCLKHCPGINDLKAPCKKQETYLYGYSNDVEHRHNCASGGIVTELLCFLVRKKIVNYVTVVTNRADSPPPQAVLTNSIKTIIDCRTSKYCPVSWHGIIKRIEDNADGCIAVCALPCQVNALKSYFSKKSISTRLIYISLLCNHTPSLNAGRFLARVIDKNARLVTIKNRGGGFPGYMSVKVNVKGKEKMKRFPFRKIMGAGYGKYFKNIRCLLCNDPFGSNADIAVGDSYFLQDTDKEGTSFCIVRNKEIHNVLKQMDTDGIITLYDGPAESVIRKAYRPLFERIKMFEIRNSIHKVLYGECVNTPIIYKGSISLRQVFGYISTTTIMRLGKYRWLWPWLIRKNKIRKLIE